MYFTSVIRFSPEHGKELPYYKIKESWDYNNLIREIETSNRQLKTDLELRPIYHQ